jgi:hypothetical protein
LEAGQRAADAQKKPTGSAQKRRSLIEFTDKTAQKSDASAEINVNKLMLSACFLVSVFGQKNAIGCAFAL